MYYLGDAKETHKSTMNNARIDLTETNCKISKHFAEVFFAAPSWVVDFAVSLWRNTTLVQKDEKVFWKAKI